MTDLFQHFALPLHVGTEGMEWHSMECCVSVIKRNTDLQIIQIKMSFYRRIFVFGHYLGHAMPLYLLS